MQNESTQANSYLMEKVMFSPSFNILEIFAVEKCMTLTFSLRIDQGRMSLFQSKARMRHATFVASRNVCPICYRFRDIHSRNVCDLDLDR